MQAQELNHYSCPRFICVESQYLRRDLLLENPKLADLISTSITDDTAIVISGISNYSQVEMAERESRGIAYVTPQDFKLMMDQIWKFVSTYQSGSSIKKSVRTLITLLEEGTQQ